MGFATGQNIAYQLTKARGFYKKIKLRNTTCKVVHTSYKIEERIEAGGVYYGEREKIYVPDGRIEK